MKQSKKPETGPVKALARQFKTPRELDDFVVALYKEAVEQMVEGELEDHLGYAKHGQRLEATSNYRNGRSAKAVRTPKGSLVLELPRDRAGSFESRLVPKRKRTIEVVEETIVSLYAKGMTTRDVAEQIREIYGLAMSDSTISRITDRILDTVHAWQERPLESRYLILWMDGLRGRSGGIAKSRPRCCIWPWD